MTASAETIAARHRIAAESRQRFAAAVAACGPGAAGYGCWMLRDKLGLEPPVIVFCCYRKGEPGWQPPAPSNLARIDRDGVTVCETPGGVKYEIGPTTVQGVTYYPFRYALHFEAIDIYRPHSPERLEASAQARAAKREAVQHERAMEQEREDASAAARAANQLQLPLGGDP